MSASQVERIRQSAHFDPDWYLEAYPDVAILGMDPAEHYALIGWRLNRLPSRHFKLPSVANGKRGIPLENPLLSEDSAMPVISDTVARNGHAAGQTRGGGAVPKVDAVIRETEAGKQTKVPHYGPMLHKLVEAAVSRFAPEGRSEEYDTVRRYFDVAYYLLRYPDIAKAKKLDVIQHYLDNGAKEGRDPSPMFSTKHYLRRYPDVAKSGLNPFYHWLTAGRAEGRIAAPFEHFEEMCEILGQPPKEVEDTLIAKRQDLRERLEYGILGEMVNKAAKLEPMIAHGWSEICSSKLQPFHSDHVVTQIAALYNMQRDAGFARAKSVVVIPHCRLSGATRIAGYLTTALAELHGESDVLVVSTDLDIMMFPEWFPEGCRHVSLPRYAKGLHRRQSEKVLVEFIRSLGATQVFNVNSSLFWDAYKSFGKAMTADTEVYAYFFCNDKNAMGHWNGYPLQKFYRHFDGLSGVITDSHFLADEFVTRYVVPESQKCKIVTLETPVPDIPPIAPTPKRRANDRPVFFWSGRFDRQKRVDIAFEIARQLPDCDFRFWGEPVLDGLGTTDNTPPNVSLLGTYSNLDDLPLEDCDAWLYTSEWDGVPNILIEIAARGVPLVGSMVGGTGEILKTGLSWPVPDYEDVDAYVRGLKEVVADQGNARMRALKLRHEVLSRRTSDEYRQVLMKFLERNRCEGANDE